MNNFSPNEGFTLVELMAVLSLSAIFVILSYSMLFSMMNTSKNTSEQTNLRNEAVFIIEHLDQQLFDIDHVEPDGTADADGAYKKIVVVDKKIVENPSGDIVEEEDKKTVEIIDKSIYIDEHPIGDAIKLNSERYSLENSSFKIIDEKYLQVRLVIEDTKSSPSRVVKELKMYKVGKSE